jgi:hypothetical protein
MVLGLSAFSSAVPPGRHAKNRCAGVREEAERAGSGVAMRHGCGGSLGAEPRPGQEDPRAAHQARPRPLPATRAAAAGGMRALGLAGLHGAGGVHLHVAGRARIIRLQHPDARPRTRRRRCACMLTCWRRASRRITTRPRSSSRRVPRSRPARRGLTAGARAEQPHQLLRQVWRCCYGSPRVRPNGRREDHDILERAPIGVHASRAVDRVHRLVRRDGAGGAVAARRELHGQCALDVCAPGHVRSRTERPRRAAAERGGPEHHHSNITGGHKCGCIVKASTVFFVFILSISV